VEDGRRSQEAAARHTIAIIKAIDKIKVPIKSYVDKDVE
jgi:hypothetical protein